MNRRRGVLALWMLLLLSGLAAALAGLVSAASHGARTAERYREGLAAQYAAESGAVWGLADIRAHGLEEGRDMSFSLDGSARTDVRLVRDKGADGEAEDGGPWTGTVYSRGTDEASGVIRYAVLTVSVSEGERRTVTVTEAGNEKW